MPSNQRVSTTPDVLSTPSLSSFLGANTVQDAGCWVWQGSLDGDGYARTFVGRKPYPAHRYVYEQLEGPIPDGRELHHTCRNRRCVSPLHLVALAPEEHRAEDARLRRRIWERQQEYVGRCPTCCIHGHSTVRPQKVAHFSLAPPQAPSLVINDGLSRLGDPGSRSLPQRPRAPLASGIQTADIAL